MNEPFLLEFGKTAVKYRVRVLQTYSCELL